MDAKLKECPFCGNPPRYLAGKSGYYTERVICDTCDFWMAPAAWGKRPAIAPPVAAGSVEREVCEICRDLEMAIRGGLREEYRAAKDRVTAFGSQQWLAGNLAGAASTQAMIDSYGRRISEAEKSADVFAERAEKAEARVKVLEEIWEATKHHRAAIAEFNKD